MHGLRLLEARAPRRFGVVADENWRNLRGDLEERDRLDLLIRDAAVLQPVAFSPRVIFALDGLSEDEPFGAEWPGPDPAATTGLLATAASASSDPIATLAQAASAWELSPPKRSPVSLPALGPAARVIASGAGAILSLCAAFLGNPDMDFADQVLLVTDTPAERQLFGLAVVALGKPTKVRLCDSAGLSASGLRALGFAGALIVISDDAQAAARAAILAATPATTP